jgi:hypothetical protein
VSYSLSEHSLLFRIVVDNFMVLGAELQWLSAFPGEAEAFPVPFSSFSLPVSIIPNVHSTLTHFLVTLRHDLPCPPVAYLVY